MTHTKDSCIKSKTMFYVVLVLFSASIFGAGQKEVKASDFDFDHCNNELKIGYLLAKKIKARCQEAEVLNAKKIHADTTCTRQLDVTENARFNDLDAQSLCANVVNSARVASDIACANHLNVWQDAVVGSLDSQSVCTNRLDSAAINSDTLCTQDLNVAHRVCASEIITNTVCTNNLSANDGCINNIVASNFLQCGRYRATMTFSGNFNYTLGDIVDWDTILDDPNGNISFVPNSQYTAPYSGYYTILLQLDQDNLQGSDVILGTPVANLEVLVNNQLFRQTFVPFLTFHNEQKATVSGLLSLQAGDVVTCRYKVLVMTDSGFTDYVGNVNILGTGAEENGSVFKIHLLSIDCPPNSTGCGPCPTGQSGTTGCLQECPELCLPATSTVCVPCVPSEPIPCSCIQCPTPCCTPCLTGLVGRV